MIALVLLNIVLNFGIFLYSLVGILRDKCRGRCPRRKLGQAAQARSVSEVQMIPIPLSDK